MGLFSSDDDASQYEKQFKSGNTARGATKGASLGATAANAVMPGNPFAMAAGAAAGGLGGAVAGNLKKANVFTAGRERLLEGELDAAQRGKLGLSEAEKQGVVSGAQEAAGANLQAQQANIARSQANAPGGMSGQYMALQRKLAGEAAGAGVSARQQAEQMSEARAQRRYAALQAALMDQEGISAARQEENAAKNAQALASVQSAAGVVLPEGKEMFGVDVSKVNDMFSVLNGTTPTAPAPAAGTPE